MELNKLRAAFIAHQIVRWHMVGQYPRQDVAQHSFRVAFLAKHICNLALARGVVVGMDPTTAFYFGASHDLGETVTGDIPSHVKKAVRNAGIDIDMLGEKEGHEDVPSMYRWIVKSADILEALMFTNAQRKTTDYRGEQIADNIATTWANHINSFDEERRMVLTQVYDDMIHIAHSRYDYNLEFDSDRS